MPKQNIEIIRHSLAHVMAAAVKEYLGKSGKVQFAIGPIIENGFYYDFDLHRRLVPEDLPEIEKIMKQIIRENLLFERREMAIEQAIKKIKLDQQPYKAELIEDLKKEGDQKVSFYKLGEIFEDLCRGPHISSTKELDPEAFKLTKIAGAYWKGDEKNKMLQRIYGVAFDNKEALDEYLKMQEEAKKRDHRKLGKDLDLFTFSDLVGKGLPLWTPYGATIRRELERFVVDEEIKRGYQHVYTPDLAKVDLYRTSGHYPYYKKDMYPPMKIDDEELILRPMSCPHHFMLYSDKLRSYRDLPLRIAELAKLYRYEQSGELSGLQRVRGFCLADSHIICRPNQAKEEIKGVLDLINYIAATLGLEKGKDYSYRLSLGDRADEKKYYKNDAMWDESERILRETLEELKEPYEAAAGEAAFYGPKIDIQMRNVNGKEDTAFTVQYDFCMPERFNLKFINEKGEEERPVVIHRSSIGALERTIAFLIEYYAGAFPLWLSPVQVKILPVSDKFIDYASKIEAELKAREIRVEIDSRSESLGKKIREAEMQKVPYMVVVGEKEQLSNKVRPRHRKEGDIGEMGIEEFIKIIEREVNKKKIDLDKAF
jgi:threonyl-tRNA synthetase